MYNPTDYWNRRSQGYTAEYHEQDVLSLVETVKRIRPKNILDVGPGTGEIAKLLIDTELIDPLNYKMCDITPGFRSECIKNTGIEPRIYVETLPYPDNWFDFVISFSVLLHVKHEDLITHLKELCRVTSKYLFISTYSPSKPEKLAPHCFAHNYPEAFREANMAVEWEDSNDNRICYLLKGDG